MVVDVNFVHERHQPQWKNLGEPGTLTSKPPIITRAWMLNLAIFRLMSSIILVGNTLDMGRRDWVSNEKFNERACSSST